MGTGDSDQEWEEGESDDGWGSWGFGENPDELEDYGWNDEESANAFEQSDGGFESAVSSRGMTGVQSSVDTSSELPLDPIEEDLSADALPGQTPHADKFDTVSHVTMSSNRKCSDGRTYRSPDEMYHTSALRVPSTTSASAYANQFWDVHVNQNLKRVHAHLLRISRFG